MMMGLRISNMTAGFVRDPVPPMPFLMIVVSRWWETEWHRRQYPPYYFSGGLPFCGASWARHQQYFKNRIIASNSLGLYWDLVSFSYFWHVLFCLFLIWSSLQFYHSSICRSLIVWTWASHYSWIGCWAFLSNLRQSLLLVWAVQNDGILCTQTDDSWQF